MAARHKAKQKSRNSINPIRSLIGKIDFTKLVSFFRAVINKIHQYLSQLQKTLNQVIKYLPKLRAYLVQQRIFILSLLLLLVFIFVTVAAIVPGTHIFEGNVISQEMSFTYNGENGKLFLNNIRDIKELENEGIQTITFTGKFASESSPQLNQLNSLKIELTDRESKLILAGANSAASSEINLNKLRLQSETKVVGMNYDFYRQQLGFSLRPNPQLRQNAPNTLDIYLGDQPIKVIVKGYKLPNLNLPQLQDEQGQLEFIVNPDNKDFKLELAQNTDVYLTLSKPPKDESKKWFREKIAAKDVKFIHVDKNSGDIRDDLEVSTIVEGKIRMVEQEREIKENQFLLGEQPDKPLNIQLIRNLQLVPTKKGIEARFSGKTKQIQIGLDKDFPVSKIQGSWLDGVLPRDAIIALFSFGAATVANLLSWLFSNASKSNNNNSSQP